jgi:hypothetical protein
MYNLSDSILSHSIVGNSQGKILYKILTDGFLKSSSKTKNAGLSGEGSPYIFVKIPISFGRQPPFSGITLILDEKLLLEHIFYLHIGWSGDKNGKKYIGKELSSSELSKILNKFKKDIQQYIQTYHKEKFFNLIMSNEILVKNNISIKKYLLEIIIHKRHIDENPKLLEYIKTNYSNVKVKILYN